MAKMRFFYLNKENNSKLPSVSFSALKVKKDNDFTLYPFSETDSNQVFIYGQGWRKIKTRNKVEVPVFSLDSDDWDYYLEKYGMRCLYFSITGRQYDSPDCCDINMQSEFSSIIKSGVERYVGFIERFLAFHEIQNGVIDRELKRTDNDYPMYREKFIFRPQYYWFYTFCPCECTLDPISDDAKMENFYHLIRHHDLIKADKRYTDYEKMTENGYSDETSSLYNEISRDCNEIVRNEINTDNNVFPCSVKDRIRFLFGEKAEELYTYMMDNFV